MGLTSKQEKFIQALLDGLSQRQAYQKAYPKSQKWKDKTVDNRASKLFNSYEVFTRYNELKNKIEEEHRKKNLWTKEKAIHALGWLMTQAQNDIKNKGIRQANSSAFLNAVKEMVEIEGLKARDEAIIQKTRAETERINGQGLEIEDMSEIESEIYGDT